MGCDVISPAFAGWGRLSPAPERGLRVMLRKLSVPAAVLALIVPMAVQAQGIIAPLSAGEKLVFPAVDEKVPSPDAFLGYPLGTRFTHWDRIVAYLEQLAAASPRVKVWEYGRTYEGR